MKFILQLLVVVGMGTGIWFLSQTPRDDFQTSLGWFVALFALVLIQFFLSKEQFSWKWVFWSGLILRLLVFLFPPQWSDDYARFLWDGEILKNSANPYVETPRQFLENPENQKNQFLNQLFPKLNSPDYNSVYTPMNQAIFWIGAVDAQGKIGKGIFALRLVLLLSEIGVLMLLVKLLRSIQKPLFWSVFYWLNPLVILETMGNLHFEGVVLLFLLASINAICQNKSALAGSFWGLAVGIKILPLMLGPSWIYFSKTNRFGKFWMGTLVVLFLGFFWLLFENSWVYLLQSLKLYQGKFEFNASVYYLLREVGFWWKGYNTIADLTKILSALTFGLLVFFSWKKRPQTLPELVDLWIVIYLIYLLFQPVVHPWYILPGLGLSILAQKWTFILWSFGAIFSYQAYSNPDFHEQPIFLILEYGLVLVGLYFDYIHSSRIKQTLA